MSTSASPPPRLLPWDTVPVPAAEECCSWVVQRPGQLAAARRAAREHLESDRVPAEAAEHVVMVLDELATNALRHGAPPATIELCAHPDGWLVIATDTAPHRMPAPTVDRPAEHGGMGLRIVADLAVRHGTDVDARRKCVWALVPG